MKRAQFAFSVGQYQSAASALTVNKSNFKPPATAARIHPSPSEDEALQLPLNPPARPPQTTVFAATLISSNDVRPIIGVPVHEGDKSLNLQFSSSALSRRPSFSFAADLSQLMAIPSKLGTDDVTLSSSSRPHYQRSNQRLRIALVGTQR
ncbi:hypothetical protein OF83DRAFT_1180216 [Amylostereum chailletii]|nr:hypothetical protein OF83DRAFT_1180216 [Amylostereum chailletii]